MILSGNAKIKRSVFAMMACILPAILAPATWAQTDESIPPNPAPNFILIVADDLGWSDLGAFGSEINTPNLDAIAAAGAILTNFHVAPTCSPTRAMLLTGVNNHAAGIGTQKGQAAPNQLDSENYRGDLLDSVATIAEVLKPHGYTTMISGKWHVGFIDEQHPDQRGFDKSYVLLDGGASHFDDALPLKPKEPVRYLENGKQVTLPEGFYSSRNYTDKILQYISEQPAGSPYFAYVAYTAPHDPLQVPDEWLGRYEGRYDEGPEATRRMRLQAARGLGLLSENTTIAPPTNPPAILPSHERPWPTRSPEQRALDVKPMEIYASMIEYMDDQIGRIVDLVKERGELENTYFIFLSDNGASPIGPLSYPGTTREWLHANRDMDPTHAGRKKTQTHLSFDWVSVANGPLALFKGTTYEGGIRSPLLISGPGIEPAGLVSGFAHVKDVAPTLYQLAGIDTSTDETFRDRKRPEGHSLLDLLESGNDKRTPVVTELFGNWSVTDGNWKLLVVGPPMGNGTPELYDLTNDLGETNDVAAVHPEIVAELHAAYEAYARENGVIPPHPKLTRDLATTFSGKCGWICQMRFDAGNFLIIKRNRQISLLAVGLCAAIIMLMIYRRYRRS
ncbi:arylsulfatase [uncultured Hyphomonas sp.]|uniref:arylsulfatase n=1 Tax=uncultured Hyphomonas sp. TaxID=225298 RepID=UPI002AAA6B2E|nr:arylsulfatase [uncultured Hyphomonas sp.]